MVAERILAAISAPYSITEGRVEIGCSVGISRYPDDGNDPEDLLQKADAAMYEAKRARMGRYYFFDPETCKTGRSIDT